MCKYSCENCPYPDCIEDELSYEEIKGSMRLDKKIKDEPTPEQLANRISTAKYDAKNREKKRRYTKEHYEANRQEKIDYVKQWQKDNREYVKAKQRDYYKRKKERQAV